MKSPSPPTGILLTPADQVSSGALVKCLTNIQPDAALNAMGLSAISQMSGVPSDSALAVVAAILTGLAGADAWLQDSWGRSGLSKLDLLTTTDDYRIQSLIERLTSPLHGMQRRLAQNMGRNSPNAIELLACGALSSPNTTKLADQNMREISLRRNRDSLLKGSQFESGNSLLEDLADDPVPARIEATLHPTFLLLGIDGAALHSLVEDCHQRTALVVQPRLDLERQGATPAKVMKNLTSLLDGATVTKRPASVERGRDSSLLAKAHAILTLTKPQIDALHEVNSQHLDRFLHLGKKDIQDIMPGNTDGCEMFQNAYQGAIEEILKRRREGQGLMAEFETPGKAAKFESELRAYEVEIQQTAASAGPWARGLPRTLFWALYFLGRSLPANCRPDDDSLMTTAFSAARRLVENHRDQVHTITNARLLAERHKLAGTIVERVATVTLPMTFREITRCSRVQTIERFAPVIDALIEVGVLVRDEKRIHALGPVDLADVREILDQKFVQN